MKATPLSDTTVFQTISGLWTGKSGPLIDGHVIRSTNFRKDGLLDYSDVALLPVEERAAATRELMMHDIIIERSGGGPKQPVGRVGLFAAPDTAKRYFTSNFTTGLRVVDRNRFDPEFVSLFMQALYSSGATETLQRATTGIRNLDWSEYLSFQIPEFDIQVQRTIARTISQTRKAYLFEECLLATITALKRAAMRELFTRGLRGEAQKDSEIGPVPESWEVASVGSHFAVGSGGTPSRGNEHFWENGNIPWVKTTEVKYNTIVETEEFITAEGLENSAAKMLPIGTLLMAMYGQGVTRGKVAILGIEATCNQACATMNRLKSGEVETRYLFHFLTCRYEEIRGMAHGGQQQNLNLDIVRDLPLAFPRDDDQQGEVISILDAIDAKIDLHKRKKVILEELFRALLHKLMTGDIRVTDLDLSALEHVQEVAI